MPKCPRTMMISRYFEGFDFLYVNFIVFRFFQDLDTEFRWIIRFFFRRSWNRHNGNKRKRPGHAVGQSRQPLLFGLVLGWGGSGTSLTGCRYRRFWPGHDWVKPKKNWAEIGCHCQNSQFRPFSSDCSPTWYSGNIFKPFSWGLYSEEKKILRCLEQKLTTWGCHRCLFWGNSFYLSERIEPSVIQIFLCHFRVSRSCFVLFGRQALAAQTTSAMLQDSGN